MVTEVEKQIIEAAKRVFLAKGYNETNMAMIAHGPNDFFIDMILRGPNMPQARVQSRIIMAPQHAKELMLALQDNIHRYEQNFGEIKLMRPAGNQGGIMDFPLPKGQA